MTEKKKHFVSLSVKPLFVLLLGLVLGACVCLLADFTGEQIIERQYNGRRITTSDLAFLN